MEKEISLEISDEKIVFADLTNREDLEVVAVCKSGNIFLVDLESRENLFLGILSFDSIPSLLNDFEPFELLQNLNPSELSDLLKNLPTEVEPIEKTIEKNPQILESLSLNLSLYSFQNYICLVQGKGANGVVLDLSNSNYRKQLKRGDYQVEHCTFPIAFYSKNNQTFLIHGTDWNRLDITCLETDELLTNRVVDYDTDSNYFDYFHSSLLISPDAKYFTSNGWVWHPYDVITVYSIENFLLKFELSRLPFDFEDVDGYNWDRPLCWINNQTLGIGYNAKEANGGKGDFASEIIFADVLENKIIDRINFDGFKLSEYGATEGNLFYDREENHFIGLNKTTGLLITDVGGNEIRKNPSFTSHKYSTKHKLFYQIDYKKQSVNLID